MTDYKKDIIELCLKELDMGKDREVVLNVLYVLAYNDGCNAIGRGYSINTASSDYGEVNDRNMEGD